jgi:two-component system NtrC family sensor kinase
MKANDRFEEPAGYHALLQSVTDYVVAINRDYKIIMANDLFNQAFDTVQDGFCYKTWKKKDDRCENCIVERAFQDGKIHRNEEKVVMKDGNIADMLIKATPVKNHNGEILYVLETATDLTGKKQLQSELNRVAGRMENLVEDRLRHLEKFEKRYRTIFERSRDAILLTDSNGQIIDINQAGVDLFGFARKDDLLIRSALELFVHKEELNRFQTILFRDGFAIEFETQLLKREGLPFDAVISANVILDIIGQVTGYVVIVRDRTKRKKAYEQIEVRNRRLATINAVSVMVSSSLDLDHVLGTTTRKIREIIGSDCVRIYLLDRRRNRLQLMAHEGLASDFVNQQHVRSREVGDGFLGETVQTGRVKVVDNLIPSGDPYVNFLVAQGFKSTAYIPLIAQGEPVGVMCVSSQAPFKFDDDFMEFLTAIGNQIGVAIHNAALHENVKAAYQELKNAQEQVIRSEKLASLGKLSATIAHEINNPLASVLTYNRLLMKLIRLGRFTDDRLGDIKKYLDIMETETARCGDIVKNLLAFSRQSKIDIKNHRMEEVLEKTLRLISHDLEIHEIRLETALETDLPDVRGDFRQMQQALLNIFSNASEAMTRGGVLSVCASRTEDGRFIEVVIADTGFGIPEENLKNIFEPFFTTKEEGKGVGLGLSVTYGIVTRHNGTVDVQSQPGKGSTFTLRFPAA